MTRHKPEQTLAQMLDYAREVEALCRDKQRIDLDQDRVLELASTRLLELIGEAANRIPADIQAQYPIIPWAQMIGLRNRLIHGYDSVDLDILWQIIRQDIPPLISNLEQIVNN